MDAGTVVPVVQTGILWGAVCQDALLIMLTLTAPVLAALLAMGLKKLRDKLGVQASYVEDQQLDAVAQKAVAAANEWAARQSQKPTGSDKMDYAMATLKALSEDATVKKFTTEQLLRLIEGTKNQVDPAKPKG